MKITLVLLNLLDTIVAVEYEEHQTGVKRNQKKK